MLKCFFYISISKMCVKHPDTAVENLNPLLYVWMVSFRRGGSGKIRYISVTVVLCFSFKRKLSPSGRAQGVRKDAPTHIVKRFRQFQGIGVGSFQVAGQEGGGCPIRHAHRTKRRILEPDQKNKRRSSKFFCGFKTVLSGSDILSLPSQSTSL